MIGHEFVDWTLVGVFMYALFALLPRRRRERWRHQRLVARPAEFIPPPKPPRPGPAANTMQPAAAQPTRSLPPDAEAQAAQIRRKRELLLQHAADLPADSEAWYILERMPDYLEDTLNGYRKLPAGSATAPDGRPAEQVLKDQLDLIDAKVDEIAEDLQRRNLDRLLANGRFLEERFGRTSS